MFFVLQVFILQVVCITSVLYYKFCMTSFLYYKCFVLQVFGITSCLYYSFFVLQVAQKVKNRINLEPTWANLSQLEPTCGPKWPNGAAHAHAYCIIRAGNGNCWASVSATINLYFKHVTCPQDTFKMASSTQTRKIHVPIGLWIFMVSIVRTAGNFEVLALAQDLPLTRSQHPRQYHCWFIEVEVV